MNMKITPEQYIEYLEGEVAKLYVEVDSLKELIKEMVKDGN